MITGGNKSNEGEQGVTRGIGGKKGKKGKQRVTRVNKG